MTNTYQVTFTVSIAADSMADAIVRVNDRLHLARTLFDADDRESFAAHAKNEGVPLLPYARSAKVVSTYHAQKHEHLMITSMNANQPRGKAV